MNDLPLVDPEHPPIDREQARSALVRVSGMHCINCVRKVEKALTPLGAQAEINLVGGTAELRWTGNPALLDDYLQAIQNLGFKAAALDAPLSLASTNPDRQPDADAEAPRVAHAVAEATPLRIGVAGLLGMQVMMLASTQYFVDAQQIEPLLRELIRQAQWWLATPALIYAGAPFLHGAWTALRQRSLTMDVTVAAAMVLAYGVSAVATLRGHGHVYFDSVTMFVFLLLIARYFENRGRAAASRHLQELAAAQQQWAQRETEAGVPEQVASAELRSGDVVVVAPGLAIPADGVLLDADAELDESLLTGESRPLRRPVGEQLCAGAINAGHAPLRLRLNRVGGDSTLSQLTRLVHRAQAQRPHVLHLADRIAGHILALVIALAAFGFWLWLPQGFDRALGVSLSVLAVTCPCALSLATPAALAAASSALARRGVLVANVDALLRLPKVDQLCLDKTGTLTESEFRIVRVDSLELPAPQVLARAAALERGLHHPLAAAFREHDDGRPVEALQAIPGRGPQGIIDGALHSLRGIDGDDGLSWVELRANGKCLARFGLQQTLRADASSTVLALQREGLQIELLSGDAPGVVEPLAAQLGLTRSAARQSPQDKLDRIHALQASGQRVWMVGDGLNDAPVLAGADVSTSLASAAALSQSRADVLLINDRLSGLTDIYRQARRTRAVIRENLLWAALYNLIAIPLALAGRVDPWIAALGMGASSLIVVVNALRLTRLRGTLAASHTESPA